MEDKCTRHIDRTTAVVAVAKRHGVKKPGRQNIVMLPTHSDLNNDKKHRFSYLYLG